MSSLYKDHADEGLDVPIIHTGIALAIIIFASLLLWGFGFLVAWALAWLLW